MLADVPQTRTMTRTQLNIRVSSLLEQAIDRKRIELGSQSTRIPSRSDVVRFALESYLSISMSEAETEPQRTRKSIKKG